MAEYKTIGTVYIIRNDIDSRCYVGSTTRKLSRRWSLHKHICQNPESDGYNRRLYQVMRELGPDNFKIERIVDVGALHHPGMNNSQRKKYNSRILKEKEREFMEARNSELNTYRAYRTNEEAIEQQREHTCRRLKAQITCECGIASVMLNINRHRRTRRHLRRMADLDAWNSVQ